MKVKTFSMKVETFFMKVDTHLMGFISEIIKIEHR